MCGRPTGSVLYFLLIVFVVCSVGPISAIKSPSATATSGLSFVKASFMAPKKNKKAAVATAATDSSSSSSVLRELKETIRSQASEIDRLREALSSSSAASTTKTATPAQAGGGHAGHHHGGAASSSGEEYMLKPFYAIACERVGWLSFFICTLSLTAMIMNGFEHTLSRQIELAYFVPLLAGHGGNTGGQAVGTVLSALSSGAVTRGDAFGVIAKEAASGLTMGLVLGAFVGPIAHYVMGISMHVSTVVSVTLPLLSTIAATLGSSLPFVCVALGLNPAVIAAPAMTSFVDVTGLLCYFLLANKVFQLFGLEL